MLKTDLRSIVVKNSISAVLFLAAAGIGTVGIGAAQTAPPAAPTAPAATASIAGPIKIGVIQAELALLQTRDGQAAKADMDKKFGPKAEVLQKQKADIDDLQNKLERGSTTMAQAAKDELQRQITSKTKNLQREAQDFQDEQMAEENKVLAELEEKMKAVIAKYASDNGLSLILNVAAENTPVLWMSQQLDITQPIIEAYDKAYPNKGMAAPARTPATAAPRPPAATAPKPPAVAPAKP
jgi:outer membrane protein